MLRSARESLAKTVITSPIDGVVSQLFAKQGEVVITGTMNNPGTRIMVISDLSKMQVKVNVHESKIETLGKALREARSQGKAIRARIKIQDRELQGILSSIANQPEPTSWFSGTPFVSRLRRVSACVTSS